MAAWVVCGCISRVRDLRLTRVQAGEADKPVTTSAVFSMFGGGAKKEKKEDEDRGDNSGSAKAQRDAAAAAAADKEGDEKVSGGYAGTDSCRSPGPCAPYHR